MAGLVFCRASIWAAKPRDILFVQALNDPKRSPVLSFGLLSAKVSAETDEHQQRRHVCFWHQADVQIVLSDVRFQG